jgi:hypothetical protein
MSGRAEDLRREAARCLTLAQSTSEPRVRGELVRMAARFHELANSTPADFDIILQVFNDAEMTRPSEPVAQQQQQIQRKKE